MNSIENLNTNDILKIAIANESMGETFYNSMAESAESNRAQHIFKKLAEEEKEHRHLFEELISTHEKEEEKLASQATSGYIKTLSGNSVFADLEKQLEQNNKSYQDITPKEALSLGIQAEKDSILLYQELFNNTDDESTKKAISNILAEEKNHLVELREQIDETY